MPTLRVSLLEGRPILDIASYARRGPGKRDRLSPAEVDEIERTVRRVPEVVLKVLPRDSNNFVSVGRHVDYIGRKGKLELETDQGDRLSGKGMGHQLLDDWDLDLDEHRQQADLAGALGRKPPKLVHKLMLSMPPGTPAAGLLAAARTFLREEFAMKHRYAFVLHTDEPHPHVHAIIKAVSEQGDRLHIKKATLREWRREFARHLRGQGIQANATERAVRGECRVQKLDGIYRANRRGVSTHTRARAEAVSGQLTNDGECAEPGRTKLVQTRKDVARGWSAISEILTREGRLQLAAQVKLFAEQMQPVRTEREQIAAALRRFARNAQTEGRPPSR